MHVLYIGVIGGKRNFQIIHMIAKLYEKKGKTVICFYSKENETNLYETIIESKQKKADVFLSVIDSNVIENIKRYPIKFHILLYLSLEDKQKHLLEKCKILLSEKNIIIINADDKRLFPFSIGAGTTLITCGLNNKASVTASSVIEEYDLERVQCCIQRTIKTVSGTRLEPQEFGISVSNHLKSVSGVLAAVTAAMAGDMEVSSLDCVL